MKSSTITQEEQLDIGRQKKILEDEQQAKEDFQVLRYQTMLQKTGILDNYVEFNNAQAEFQKLYEEEGVAAKSKMLSTLKEMSKRGRYLQKNYTDIVESRISELKKVDQQLIDIDTGKNLDISKDDLIKQQTQLKDELKTAQTNKKKFEATLGVTDLAIGKLDALTDGSSLDRTQAVLSGFSSLWEITTENIIDKGKASKASNAFTSASKWISGKDSLTPQVSKGLATKTLGIGSDAAAFAQSFTKGQEEGWTDKSILDITAKSVALATDMVSLIPLSSKFVLTGMIVEAATIGLAAAAGGNIPGGPTVGIMQSLAPLLGKAGFGFSSLISAIQEAGKGNDLKVGMHAAAGAIAALPIPGARVLSAILTTVTNAIDMEAFDGETREQRLSGQYNTVSNIPILGQFLLLDHGFQQEKAEANAQSSIEKAFLDFAKEEYLDEWKILYQYEWHKAGDGNRPEAGVVQYFPDTGNPKIQINPSTGEVTYPDGYDQKKVDERLAAAEEKNSGQFLAIANAASDDWRFTESLEELASSSKGANNGLKMISRGNGSQPTMVGGPKNDVIYIQENNRVDIDGLGGDDFFMAGSHFPQKVGLHTRTYFGGEGKDTISFSGLNAGKYTNLEIDLRQAGSQISVLRNLSTANLTVKDFEVFVGGSGHDNLYSDDNAHTLNGGAGDDNLYGNGGNDVLISGEGIDGMSGGEGDDLLVLGKGNKFINGGKGSDSILFSDFADGVVFVGVKDKDGLDPRQFFGSDQPLQNYADKGVSAQFKNIERIYATKKNDIVLLDRYEDGDLLIELQDGDDIFVGSKGAELIDTGKGKDIVVAMEGNDDIYLGGTNQIIDGGEGYDRAFLTFEGFQEIRMKDGRYSLGHQIEKVIPDYTIPHRWSTVGDFPKSFESDEVSYVYGIEELYGSDTNESITGSSADDNIMSRDGDDMVSGEDGNDRLSLGDGADYGYGNNGDDTLTGGDGNDKLYGDSGDDSLLGEGDNDTLSGGDGNDTLIGGEGDDELWGAAGKNLYLGGEGDDMLWGLPGGGEDTLAGGTGKNTLFARDGNKDIIQASSGKGMDILRTYDSNDVIDFGEAFDESDLKIWSSGQDINIAVFERGDIINEVILENESQNGFKPIEIAFGHDSFSFTEDMIKETPNYFIETPMYGSSETDELIGTDAHEALHGLAGPDILNGSGGLDEIYPGAGLDRIYTNDSEKDEIYIRTGDEENVLKKYDSIDVLEFGRNFDKEDLRIWRGGQYGEVTVAITENQHISASVALQTTNDNNFQPINIGIGDEVFPLTESMITESPNEVPVF
ncbi:MAG: calcium-binding protein [Cyanobacteria bacterium J06592_8]